MTIKGLAIMKFVIVIMHISTPYRTNRFCFWLLLVALKNFRT